MNKRERKKFEKMLLEMREKKAAYIAMLRELAISRTQRDASGDISAFTSHPADISNESDEREKVASLITRETEILRNSTWRWSASKTPSTASAKYAAATYRRLDSKRCRSLRYV
jgi:hypothetical protein